MSRLRVVGLAALLVLPGTLQAQATGRYAAYRSPVACLGVLMRSMIGNGWETPPDTMPLNPDDMIAVAPRDSMTQCYQRFYPNGPDVQKVPDQEVASLFYWGRVTGNDSLAARAFRRALGQQKLWIDTTDLHWHATYAYSSRPYRLPVAQAHAARLDALGVVGERPMMPMDDMWESQHDGPSSNAKTFFDTLALRVETEGELRNYRALPDTAKHGAEMIGVMTEAQRLLLTLVRNPRADSAVAALKARAIEVLGADQLKGRWGEGMLLLGDRFAPIHPDFWFNRAGGDSVIPRPGRVTIIQAITPQRCFCEQMYSSIGRLKRRFGDSVDVVLVAQTQGHWARRVQLTPAEEAGLLKRAIIDSLKVPATLGVYTTSYDTVPAPDSRLMAKVIPEIKHIFFSNGALIIDRRGIVQLAGLIDLGAWNERAMIALVTSLLSAPAN